MNELERLKNKLRCLEQQIGEISKSEGSNSPSYNQIFTDLCTTHALIEIESEKESFKPEELDEACINIGDTFDVIEKGRVSSYSLVNYECGKQYNLTEEGIIEITPNSCLGTVFYGKKIGDVAETSLPDGSQYNATVISIERLTEIAKDSCLNIK